MSTLAIRLKQARLAADLSQERLGIEAGLEPASASARMNRYELGKRSPDLELVERLAAVLNVPTAFFYTQDDDLADLLLNIHQLSAHDRELVTQLVTKLRSLGSKS